MDFVATTIILLATVISIYGAYNVSGDSRESRRHGFKLWQISNLFWIVTFLMGVFGLISAPVFKIQQVCAGITFIVYFICNYRGMKHNGDQR